ncbi:MAG: DNA primase [Phycisphaerales bacterium]|nr:MAG: DNA primase [Phycisphaerales bacterium]
MRDFELKKRQILDRVDILDVVSEQVTLKRSGRRWVGLCPFHTEKTPSFTVQPDRGSFKCFGCGKGGDVFSFVQFRENVSFMEAMRILAERAGVHLSDAPLGESAGPGRADLARINTWATRFFRAQLLDPSVGRSTREYLRIRQVSDKTADQFDLGLATEGTSGLREAAARAGIETSLLLAADLLRRSDDERLYDTFRNRLMFPIRDTSNRVVGFGGRTLGDDRAKYLNTRQNVLFDKGRNLYGVDLARNAITQRRRVVVVEGYTDCLAAHQAGFAETVATLGTALTEPQVDLLRRYCDEIILLFDSDRAGEAAADRAIHVALPRCIAVRLARVPDGKDPSEFLSRTSAEAFSDLLNRSVDALEFKWRQTEQRFRGDASDASRREAILDFLRVVAEAADTRAVDAIQRGLLVNQVAHLLRMDRSEVDRLMIGLRARRTQGAAPPGGGAGQAPRPVPPDAEQAAWTRVLEVLLDEPGVLEAPECFPDISRITDDRDRRIAAVVRELLDNPDGFRIADVLARFQDPADVARVMELAERGEKRGNHEDTMRTALEQIRRSLRDDEVEQSKRRYFAAQTAGEATEIARDQFASFGEEVRKHRNYLHIPRRLSRPPAAGAGTTDNTNEATSVEQP